MAGLEQHTTDLRRIVLMTAERQTPMFRIEFELSRPGKLRRLFVNRVYTYEDVSGCMVSGFMFRIGWVFMRAVWSTGYR